MAVGQSQVERVKADLGVELPVICGAMYPCSNPELVAAVSEAGGIGVVQPLSLIYVWGYGFRDGLQAIRRMTSKPYGFNAILEKSSKVYEDRMKQWIDIALEEGCRFFVTALGKPDWVVKKVHAVGGKVYHDVTERRWADKALDVGVDGLICVNGRAGGHAGSRSPQQLVEELSGVGLPMVCAGGVSTPDDFKAMLELGYGGVQMGTRFIATEECASHLDYKKAIVDASEEDIVLTERVTGIPLSVIRTPYVDRIGTKAGWFARRMLKGRKTKEWMRIFYNLKALRDMKRSVRKGFSTKDYWQAGKSVAGVHKVEPVSKVLSGFKAVFSEWGTQG